jgi:hypothetical protein|tara:strand:+ start:222 stop:626 length:405 start_codon:yes stop_codon:yes gene_type:complete
MASFAKIGLNGKVMSVVSIANEALQDSKNIEREELGIELLTELTHWPIWKQTSYNTKGGVHLLGGTPLRKNHAGIGYTYDDDKDAFIPPKSFATWILDEETCQWKPPIDKPNDEQNYVWNEETQQWEVLTIPGN